jgi:hypothetical protein
MGRLIYDSNSFKIDSNLLISCHIPVVLKLPTIIMTIIHFLPCTQNQMHVNIFYKTKYLIKMVVEHLRHD